MTKTAVQWQEEADNFAAEWERATGNKPTLEDIVAECKDIGIENYKEYAEQLFEYMGGRFYEKGY